MLLLMKPTYIRVILTRSNKDKIGVEVLGVKFSLKMITMIRSLCPCAMNLLRKLMHRVRVADNIIWDKSLTLLLRLLRVRI